MIPVVIVCRGLTGMEISPRHDDPSGLFLAAYDAEAHQGRGVVTWTADLKKAKVFDSVVDAIRCYRTIPRRRPMRQDGRPNRPLTAYTVEFVNLDAVPTGDDE